MKIVTAIALIGTGYILNDRKYHPRAHSSELKRHLTQILIDKIDLLCYGRCQWRPCMDVRRDYDAYYHRYDQPEPTRYVHRARTPKIKVDTILFATEDDAKDALNVIKYLYDEYGRVTLADYYEACDPFHINYQPEYTDAKYGWTCINSCVRVREDKLNHTYYIDLPEPEALD